MGEENLAKLRVDLPNHLATGGDSMWARVLENDLYEIDNIPFYAYGINYRDVVYATSDAPDLKPEIRNVVKRSGHQTLRIIFKSGISKDKQAPYLEYIRTAGASIERASESYLAIEVPPSAGWEELRAYLDRLKGQQVLEYETCEERVPGSFDEAPPEETSRDKDRL
jgi:hypothetical protein